jgi:hypothetical protein
VGLQGETAVTKGDASKVRPKYPCSPVRCAEQINTAGEAVGPAVLVHCVLLFVVYHFFVDVLAMAGPLKRKTICLSFLRES